MCVCVCVCVCVCMRARVYTIHADNINEYEIINEKCVNVSAHFLSYLHLVANEYEINYSFRSNEAEI